MQPSFSLRDEPFTRSARWAARFGIFALPVMGITFLLLRQSGVPVEHVQMAMFAGALCGLLGIVFGIAALCVIWVKGWRGTKAALLGIVAGCTALVFPVWFVVQQITHPPLYDISTDVGNPPMFEAAISARASFDYPINRFDEGGALPQLSAYPDVQSLDVEIGTEEAFGLVREAVTGRKWQVLTTKAPEAGMEGSIEVHFRSGVLGMANDAVIRVAPTEKGSRIDMRSAARKWRHDMGTNAAAITAFMADLRQSAAE